jgi:hypothetical protein
MAKQAALSIRILESIKRDLDKAAARQHRSTSSLVEKILDDYLREEKGQPRQYPDPDKWVAAGHSALELPLPVGKVLRRANKDDLRKLSEAYKKVGDERDKRLAWENKKSRATAKKTRQ